MQEKQKKTQVAQCICFPLTKKYFAGTKWLQKNNSFVDEKDLGHTVQQHKQIAVNEKLTQSTLVVECKGL